MTQRILCILAFWWCGTHAVAHELQANRLTLVLREGTHVSLTFRLDFTDVLHRALAPQRTVQEFVLQYAAMPPHAFQSDLLRAQRQFQAATGLATAAGKVATLTHWTWPDAEQVQAALRERAMQTVVAPGAHPHTTPVEVVAEATVAQAISAVTVRLPKEFQPVLLVSYRPQQVWMAPQARSTTVKF